MKEATRQLVLDLEVPDAVEEHWDYDAQQDMALVREVARRQIEDLKDKPAWYADYEGFVQGRWPWRVAMYMAWASSPAEGRWPGTLKELASLIGLKSPNAIHAWRRKNPAIDTTVTLLEAEPILKHRRDHFEALNKGAIKAGDDYKYFHYLKLVMEMRGDYIPRGQLDIGAAATGDDLSELSEAELAEAAAMGLEVPTPNPSLKGGESDESGEGED